ncbi:DUF6191 domain-containing protein [Streptomyces antibioticus]|uniref:DUF6191 domain-containing protein n=1 Tax=Streptomyces antibioticus TaxID=1890 RepID=UPI0036B0D9E4
MEFAVFATLPGLVILLTVVAFVDQLLLRAGRAGFLPWRNSARQGQISATGFEQLHASLSPGKQNELKERQSALVMRDDEEDGAPRLCTTSAVPVPTTASAVGTIQGRLSTLRRTWSRE